MRDHYELMKGDIRSLDFCSYMLLQVLRTVVAMIISTDTTVANIIVSMNIFYY